MGPLRSTFPTGAHVVDLHASGALAALPGLVSYLRATSPHALIAAQNHINLVAVVACMLAHTRTRLFLSEHNDMLEGAHNARGLINRLRPFASRVLYRRAEGIIAVSEGVAESVEAVARLPRRRIHTIYNPALPDDLDALVQMDPGVPWLSSKDEPVILAVGRLAVQKDFPTLLKALALLRHEVPARLIILGEGPERPRLEKCALELGIAAHVLMPGFNENPFACMAHSDVFALSSKYEGFPSVLVEALACGANIVATNCRSGPAEILDHGSFGRLVPVGDAPSMAHALRAALEERSVSTDRAVRRAAEFSTSRAADAYLSLLFPETGR